ncbi:hypothetical protein NQZ68_034502 [Dissostichus eleginoides]|nr:hypothetical protein NQZ68_034502 [Dissostichus eleginoides]
MHITELEIAAASPSHCAKLGTEALWTGGCWLEPDNEPPQGGEKIRATMWLCAPTGGVYGLPCEFYSKLALFKKPGWC